MDRDTPIHHTHTHTHTHTHIHSNTQLHKAMSSVELKASTAMAGSTADPTSPPDGSPLAADHLWVKATVTGARWPSAALHSTLFHQLNWHGNQTDWTSWYITIRHHLAILCSRFNMKRVKLKLDCSQFGLLFLITLASRFGGFKWSEQINTIASSASIHFKCKLAIGKWRDLLQRLYQQTFCRLHPIASIDRSNSN